MCNESGWQAAASKSQPTTLYMHAWVCMCVPVFLLALSWLWL